jgi:hypothetical protein
MVHFGNGQIVANMATLEMSEDCKKEIHFCDDLVTAKTSTISYWSYFGKEIVHFGNDQ